MSTISIKNDATTAIIHKKGAQMLSFKGNDGREVMWQGDAVWKDTSPVLFPVCGAPKDHHVIIDGQAYPMPRHGFACKHEFQVAQQGNNFVDLVLTASEETKRCYPFDFAFHVIYTLFENGFRVDYVVENKSNQVMPFCVGGHPGFYVPMEDNACYTDYEFVFPQQEDGLNLLVTDDGLMDGEEILPLENGTTIPLSHDLFDERDSLVFSNWKSRSVELVHKHTRKGLRINYPSMEVLVIWSMPKTNSNYVCIEPWHGMPGHVTESGKYEDKAFVTLLQPASSHQCGFSVELI